MTSLPIHLAFLGCGFITDVHSRHLRTLGRFRCSYASRDAAKADATRKRWGGMRAFAGYEQALADADVAAVVIAVPPKYHLDLTLRALAAGKHVLVEKPAFPSTADYASVASARDRAGRVVMVAENDHYKPLVRSLQRLLDAQAIGELVFVHLVTVAHRLKSADDWRNDETMAGGDAFFEEGIHWLHLAGALGPRIVEVHGFRPTPSVEGPDRRAKSLMAAFRYDNGAVGSLYYSREIPSALSGLRVSKLFGRRGVISFESNGAFVFVRGQGLPRVWCPGIRDIRGYRAMYEDFASAITTGRPPEMSLERALDDQRLMDVIYRGSGVS